MKIRRSIVVLLTVAGIVASTSPVPVFAETAVVSPAGHFKFHLDRWISLHHFAYHFVREEAQVKVRGRVPLTEEDRQALSPEVRSACASLAPAYGPYIEKSLLHDRETRALAKALTKGPEALSDIALRDALIACMPMYEKVLWPRHKLAGKELLKSLLILLMQHEEVMAKRFAENLEATWPDSPIRVDISPYANWAGAYTDDPPPNITISSFDKDIAGRFAFEILFHEAGHTGEFGQSLLSAANAGLDSAGLTSDRYWHYILFFVAGRTTQNVLENEDYVPFSKAIGLTETDHARDYYKAMEETWDTGNSFHERVRLAAQQVSSERASSKQVAK